MKVPADLRQQGGAVLEYWTQHPQLTAREALFATLGPKLLERNQALASARFSEHMGLEAALSEPKKYQRLEEVLLESFQEAQDKQTQSRA